MSVFASTRKQSLAKSSKDLELLTEKVISSKLNSLLGHNANDIRRESAIKSADALTACDLGEAVEEPRELARFVHLKLSLCHIQRIDGRCACSIKLDKDRTKQSRVYPPSGACLKQREQGRNLRPATPPAAEKVIFLARLSSAAARMYRWVSMFWFGDCILRLNLTVFHVNPLDGNS
jgi:hypothetical protein